MRGLFSFLPPICGRGGISLSLNRSGSATMQEEGVSPLLFHGRGFSLSPLHLVWWGGSLSLCLSQYVEGWGVSLLPSAGYWRTVSPSLSIQKRVSLLPALSMWWFGVFPLLVCDGVSLALVLIIWWWVSLCCTPYAVGWGSPSFLHSPACGGLGSFPLSPSVYDGGLPPLVLIIWCWGGFLFCIW